MAEQLNKLIDNLKEFWQKLESKTKKIIIWSTVGVLTFAIGLTVFINLPKMGYKTIFQGMSNTEAAEVYAVLLEMDVRPEIDNNGNVLVPKDQWDDLQYQLSARGYPKTTLTYDTFSNMSGFTTTEFEKRVALTYQLQDRLQSTLGRWSGIADAAVIINIPESSNFVWDQAQQEVSTASVTVNLRPGYSLEPRQVSAIKNHVASAVPKLLAKDVVVIDAATGIEPLSQEEQYGGYSTARLDYEREWEKAIEDSVKRLLGPTYGASGVTAVAKVSIDYDKMITERKDVLTQEETGEGVLTDIREYYTTGGDAIAQGLAGENDNTDIPEYPNLSGLGDNEINVFDRTRHYDTGYLLTQLEKIEPYLEEATLSVIVNDDNFTTEKQELLVELVSKSVNIPHYNIMVASMGLDSTATIAPVEQTTSWMTYAIIAGLAILLVGMFALIIITILRNNRKRKQVAFMAEEAELEDQRQRDLEKEIANHKRMLQEEAQASANLKEDAITQEVRDFASRNPEVTANLIRTLLKEDR